ncbi:MAG: preprotein translocase subunit SecG, partial [Clostridia bacterium]|nr:preprotein translocase subunit SecG [Clostridia bacterium]
MYMALQVVQLICALGVIATVLLQSGRSAGLSGSISCGAETFLV